MAEVEHFGEHDNKKQPMETPDGPGNIGVGDRYLKGFPPKNRVLRPSAAYHENCSSYSCRISELVFGSLLASYILGFMTFGATSKSAWDFFHYMTISVTFAFLTAAFYTSYHISILTMPHVDFGELTTDFAIALLQAVLFGTSMLFPFAFLILVAAILIVAFLRQLQQSRALGEFLFDRLELNQTERASPKTDKLFRTALATKQSYPSLQGWAPVPKTLWCATMALAVVGFCILQVGFDHPRRVNASTNLQWFVDFHSIGITIDVLVAAAIVCMTFRTIRRKAVATRTIHAQMDEAAQTLVFAMKNDNNPRSTT